MKKADNSKLNKYTEDRSFGKISSETKVKLPVKRFRVISRCLDYNNYYTSVGILESSLNTFRKV